MRTIKEDIAESAGWISRALQSSGYRADFSPESLWEIARFFDDHSVNGKAAGAGVRVYWTCAPRKKRNR